VNVPPSRSAGEIWPSGTRPANKRGSVGSDEGFDVSIEHGRDAQRILNPGQRDR
jgi:hypothetical protein